MRDLWYTTRKGIHSVYPIYPHRDRVAPRETEPARAAKPPRRTMDAASCQPVQGADPAVLTGINLSAAAGGDWRAQPQHTRNMVVIKILEALKKHLPVSTPQGLDELLQIAVRFEERTYSKHTNKDDYLWKVDQKLLSMEEKLQQLPGNAQVIPNQNPLGPGGLPLLTMGRSRL